MPPNKNIKIVNPGEIVTFKSGEARLKREYFWKPVFDLEFYSNDENIYDRYIRVLEPSVRRHLVSDVPIGFYLSSGIDSSSVVYYSKKFLKED